MLIGSAILGGAICLGLGSTARELGGKNNTLEGKIQLIWKRNNVFIETNDSVQKDSPSRKLRPEFVNKSWEGNNPVLYFKLPAGMGYDKIIKSAGAVFDGLKKEIILKWLENDVDADFSIKILSGQLKNIVYFNQEWKELQKKKAEGGFVVPIGWSRRQFETIQMSDNNSSHILVAGAIGTGKTKLLRFILTCLHLVYNPKEVQMWLCDMKNGNEFDWFKNSPMCQKFIERPEQACEFFTNLLDHTYERYQLIKEAGYVDIDDYNANEDEKLHRVLCVVDEYAMLEDDSEEGNKVAKIKIKQIAAIGRAAGVHLIVATQRPDHKVIDGTLKNNIPIKLCFRMNTPQSSQIVLNNDRATKIDPEIQGRAILQHFQEVEVQVPYIADNICREIMNKITRGRVKQERTLPDNVIALPKAQ